MSSRATRSPCRSICDDPGADHHWLGRRDPQRPGPAVGAGRGGDGPAARRAADAPAGDRGPRVVGDELHRKLSAVGLVPARKTLALAEFLDSYLESRSIDGTKIGTLVNDRRAANDLVALLGAATDLRSIGVREADSLKAAYQQ